MAEEKKGSSALLWGILLLVGAGFAFYEYRQRSNAALQVSTASKAGGGNGTSVNGATYFAANYPGLYSMMQAANATPAEYAAVLSWWRNGGSGNGMPGGTGPGSDYQTVVAFQARANLNLQDYYGAPGSHPTF